MADLEQNIQQILEKADIRINGDRPWDLQVHNKQLYNRVLKEGSLGLGEAYMDRWWDAEALDEFFNHILRAGLQKEVAISWPMIWTFIKSWIQNPQTQQRSFKVGEQHYNTGNDLFKAMLDERMVYTCGYWVEGADTLEQAQEKNLIWCARKWPFSRASEYWISAAAGEALLSMRPKNMMWKWWE